MLAAAAAKSRLSIVAYVCVIFHFLCGVPITLVGLAFRSSEKRKFSCFVHDNVSTTYKEQIDHECFLKYDQTYNSPMPWYAFVLLSTVWNIFISVFYEMVVSRRVDEIWSNHRRQTVKRTVYVFYSYFVHLFSRALFGIIFTVLQHAYFYPKGFDLKFTCYLPPTDQVTTSDIHTSRNVSYNNKSLASLTCENATASHKSSLGVTLSVVNIIVAFIMLVEMIYLLRRFSIPSLLSEADKINDCTFVTVYLLRHQNNEEHHLLQGPSTQHYNPHDNKQGNNTQNPIHFYKQQVKNRSRAYENYIEKTSLDMYIDIIIHTERARYKFSRNMERHEIYDVYMKVPSDSIRLEKIEDLFNPGKDTKDILPRSILVTGRPRIGKTVLTEKLLRDWANESDEFYRDKIVFFFKLRCFHRPEFKNISLKTFLQLGTRLDIEKIESIYQKIVNQAEKAIFIFDGLDECNGTPIESLNQSNMIANDCSECMSGMSLFIKLVRGKMLKGATILVTSRPAAYDFYTKLDFDRNVEIIGFTSNKIEEYVSRFCDNKNRSDLKQAIWNHIISSSELLNLCYIPVNCFIMCTTLYECLNDLENLHTNILPMTLTELCEIALYYVGKNHQQNADANGSAQETFTKLQLIAFNGIENGQLIFEHELFDEQMKASGLLNHLTESTVSPHQFCFTNLTIQEFLAARHVTETFPFAKIKTFILDHVKLKKWHLVLQFISGLLSKKINEFPEESKDCILAFVEGLDVISDGHNSDHKQVFLNYNEVCVMRCLREVNNEEIVKDVCETTIMNDVVELCSKSDVDLSSGEWAAVTAVSKHMRKLVILDLYCQNKDSLPSVQQLLEKRCIMRLELTAVPAQEGMDNVFSTLIDISCTFKDRHTCAKLTTLKIVCIYTTDERLTNICKFFENGHGSHLEILDLRHNKFSRMSKLLEIFKSECCPKLAHLCLFGNAIYDEDAELLWDALTKGLRKLTTLDVSHCRLTNQCIPSLCKALQDERCQLTVLSLNSNDIGDEGACTLFETAFTKENCKLTKLRLCHCWLTDRCVPALHKALKDRRRSIDLDLNGNSFTEKDKRVKNVALNPRGGKRYLAEINR